MKTQLLTVQKPEVWRNFARLTRTSMIRWSRPETVDSDSVANHRGKHGRYHSESMRWALYLTVQCDESFSRSRQKSNKSYRALPHVTKIWQKLVIILLYGCTTWLHYNMETPQGRLENVLRKSLMESPYKRY